MKSKAPAYPYLIWMLIFTVIPLIMVVYYAFTDKSGNFTLQSFADSLFYTDVFIRSLWIALISTAICLLLAYPLSYIMSRAKKSTQSVLTMLIMLPMWMNFILRIYAWVLLLQNDGLVDIGVKLLGLDVPLLGNAGAVVLGMVYNFLPYMILPIYTVMLKADRSLVEAAQDLGGNKLDVFRNVTIPLSLPGIVSGFTMVFVPSVSTFFISQKLGGTGTTLIGDIIETQFQTANNFNLGASLSFVLMILIFICLAVMNKFSDDDGGVVI